jgi:very-short-patch-repair endonuclease/DNA polymerase III delta prime subunit
MSQAANRLSAPLENETVAISGERRALIDQARKAWCDQLIDRSRRNNLLYFRALKTGTLDLSQAEPEVLSALLGGETVLLSNLLPAADEIQTPAAVRTIHRRALANLEEKGLQTLFLALGMATWPACDDGRDPQAAVLLLPMSIEWRGRDGRSVALRRSGDVHVNLVLLHALEVELGCRITPEILLGNGVDEGTDDTGISAEIACIDRAATYRRLREATGEILGFAVHDRAVLGNFSFQKLAMVKDLQELGEKLVAHDVIAAIAGDNAARSNVRSTWHEIEPGELDRVPPGEEYLVRDADSSQQAVIAAARRGQHLVIQGPPGTGKSQTIVNLIASLAAEGRRILFVAEKRAALEVVRDRLREVGLEHLALDLHGADLSRRAILDRLRNGLNRMREAAPVDAEVFHQRFTDYRSRLNEYVARIHRLHAPALKSIYDLQGMLLRTPDEARARTRWRQAELDRLDTGKATAISELLREAAGFDGLFTRTHPSPWAGAQLPDGTSAQRAVDAVVRIATAHWPELREAMEDLVTRTQLPWPESLGQTRALISLVQAVSQTLERYVCDLLQQDLSALRADLAPGNKGTLARWWAVCSNSRYRKARHIARSLRKDRAIADAELFQEVSAAASQVEEWRAWSAHAPIPQAPVNIEAPNRALRALQEDLETLEQALGRPNLQALPSRELERLVSTLAGDVATPHRIPRLLQIESEIREHGAEAIGREIRSQKLDPCHWPSLFESAWVASCFDRARMEDPKISGFNGRSHEEIVAGFREADLERLNLAAARVRRAHAEHVVLVMNRHPEQEALVKHETEKRSRHLPLRTLLARAPDVLTALCPCWMASPLSVSQLLAGDRRYFDVVIFDEASQVLPHDAVPALLRATQAVVAGDEHQLPPTLFFADGGGDDGADDDVAPTAGFESLLQVMRSIVERPLPLQWHYRSQDESLIAFSNYHIYRPHGQEMITFPGPQEMGAVTHVLVNQTPRQAGQEESCSDEVRQMVALVLEHARKRPNETLGVIALGIRHALRLQAALDDALRSHPELDAFFNETRHERFFIKNLERVQGDERDSIILSLGYGKDSTGKLLYRFGPLNQDGGERRLNVAVTRARRRMTLVSSFSHHDMDPNRSRSEGVKLLRLYLEFAASRGKTLGERQVCETPLNFLEADVYETLSKRGMCLLPQWGASRYRIDLVAQHPTRPGRFVLAIECDGASYHSAPTARDRDRLRQQQLESLGWRFHRIWSTDWFMRREEEIERAWAAYQAAIAWADQEDARPDRSADPESFVSDESTTCSVGPSPNARGPRPSVSRKENITQYTLHELCSLIRWINSDGRPRTDAELVSELIAELGFRKRGSRIEATCRQAIEQVRSSVKSGSRQDENKPWYAS